MISSLKTIIRLRSIFLTVLMISISLFSCQAPDPVKLIFMLDSSASSARYRPQAIATVKSMARRLDPKLDTIVVYKLSEDVFSIYSGSPKQSKFIEIMDTYAVSKPNEHGTAYGQALKRGLEEILIPNDKRIKQGLIFLGDGADEKVNSGGNLTNDDLNKLINKLPKDSFLGFLYIEPENGDRFRQILLPILHEDRLQIVTPVEAEENKQALNKFNQWLGR